MTEFVNISFDGHRSYDDWGLMVENMSVSFPQPVENKISVPGMDGRLDLSEINAPLTYDEREVRFTFSRCGKYEDWHRLSSIIANAIHGKAVRIIIDTDPGYYYTGRVTLETGKDDEVSEDLVISGTVDPYKYDLHDGTDDWLWDPFSFDSGIIRNYKDIKINNRGTVTVIGRRKRVIPVVICSAPMVLTYGKFTINLSAGHTKVYELQLGEGKHELTFTGNGTVTISYRGGSL